ncbi:hypothetical protein KC19_11G084700 [Ceratodon purpureus]|uniref:Uncharacterized protein n=1 Tax=Ceratodon purpureus TaxID=3225 RepID=A0A8T0GI92_CERPU|nr:hypothetical protein KC19_11G084700 [Ceratodon purpureus]
MNHEVYTGHRLYGTLHWISSEQIHKTEGEHRQTELTRNPGGLRSVCSSACRTW